MGSAPQRTRLGTRLGLVGLWATCAAARAALPGEIRRRAGVRSPKGVLRPAKSSATEQGGLGVLTKGPRWLELLRGVTGVDGERRRTTLCTGAGRCGAPPVAQAPRVDERQRCEGCPGVRGAQGSPAARNREAGQLPTAALQAKSRPLKRSEQRAAGSGKCLGTGRGCCALLGGLRRGGAARPRRRGALLRRGGRGGVEPGFGAALAGRVRAQGVAGWFKGAGRGSRRACPGKGAARITAGDFGRDWRGRVGREGPDMGGRAVSGAGAVGARGLRGVGKGGWQVGRPGCGCVAWCH